MYSEQFTKAYERRETMDAVIPEERFSANVLEFNGVRDYYFDFIRSNELAAEELEEYRGILAEQFTGFNQGVLVSAFLNDVYIPELFEQVWDQSEDLDFKFWMDTLVSAKAIVSIVSSTGLLEADNVESALVTIAEENVNTYSEDGSELDAYLEIHNIITHVRTQLLDRDSSQSGFTLIDYLTRVYSENPQLFSTSSGLEYNPECIKLGIKFGRDLYKLYYEKVFGTPGSNVIPAPALT